MHPIVKYLVNSLVDGKSINWQEVNKELDRLTISEREKELIRNLRIVYNVMHWEEINEQKRTAGTN